MRETYAEITCILCLQYCKVRSMKHRRKTLHIWCISFQNQSVVKYDNEISLAGIIMLSSRCVIFVLPWMTPTVYVTFVTYTHTHTHTHIYIYILVVCKPFKHPVKTHCDVGVNEQSMDYKTHVASSWYGQSRCVLMTNLSTEKVAQISGTRDMPVSTPRCVLY